MDIIKEEDNVIRVKRHQGIKVIVVLVIIAAVVAGIYYYMTHKSFTKYEIASTTDRSEDSKLEYIVFQGGIVKYSKEGASYIDRQNNVVWSKSFSMKNPSAVTCGEYVAVADTNGSDIFVFNLKGLVNNKTMQYPITDVAVAEQGVTAVVLESDTNNLIQTYDTEGEKCVEIKTTISQNGYPMDIALSNDGEKLVASYITLNGTTENTTLTFYNFGSVGQNEVDRLVGAKTFEAAVVPSIQFLNNDTVCAFGDDQVFLYSMKEKPGKIQDYKVKGEICNIFYNEKYFGYSYRNADTKVKSKNYLLKAYNLKGNEVLSMGFDSQCDKVRSTKDQLIVINENNCYLYNYYGTLKFKNDFGGGVTDLISTDKNGEYILLNDTSSEVIQLK